MLPAMNAVERRVLGVLMEKALAQPQYYPMTVNAIVAACNQKNNRDPVMELDEDAVWNTLEVLRAGGLVSRLLPGGASRVERYRHEAKEQLGWEKPQRAILSELLLRGPQTLGELRTRCTRMYPFDSVESITAVVEGLAQTDPPVVTPLPRAPGQSVIRYAHRLYREDEWARLTSGAETAAVPPVSRTSAVPAPVPGAPEAATRADHLVELTARLNTLEQRVAELERRATAT
jgi:hypothetical protein